MKVALIHEHKYIRGGVATYAAHLSMGGIADGHDVKIFKIGKVNRVIDFYCGTKYHISPLKDILSWADFVIVTCVSEDSMEASEVADLIVMHDPTHLKGKRGELFFGRGENTIVIRKCNEELIPGSRFIRHPYVRQERDSTHDGLACCRSRITKVKNISWIIEANSILKNKIIMYGNGDRLYMHYTLDKKYPDWRGSVSNNGKGFNKEFETPVRICGNYKYDVDLTNYIGDGGGTQYTLLEAMDAGSIPILNLDWMGSGSGNLIRGKNYLAVNSSESLFYTLFEDRKANIGIIKNNTQYIKKHKASKVFKEYIS